MQINYDPEFVLTQEHTEDEERNFTGSFCGFVLLKETAYNLHALTKRLEKQLHIPSCMTDDRNMINDLMLDVPGALVTISLIEAPIPEHEAEAAAVHAQWSNAKMIAQSHKAHLMIAVLPDRMTAIEAGHLYCSIISEALQDQQALAVYTSGTILEPVQFQQCIAQSGSELPIENLIYIGTYIRETGTCGYTIGMDAFGKDEFEILDSGASVETISHVLRQCAKHSLEADTPSQWYMTIEIDGVQWEGRRKDGVMVEGHSIQLTQLFSA